jgi:hypothetical protein
MATYTPIVGSENATGQMIAVAATSSPGTTIHTSHATSIDEVSIFATNTDTTARKLSIQLGGTATSDLIEQTIQPEAGEVLVVDAARLTGSVLVKAFAATTNVINCRVVVNRIS